MRRAAALSVAMFPFAAATYTALHYQAVGAEDGVLWCIALLAVLLAICVVGAEVERRIGE